MYGANMCLFKCVLKPLRFKSTIEQYNHGFNTFDALFSSMKNTSLFNDFPPISKEEWIEKLQSDLKGKAYKELNKINDAGIDIEAIYNSESQNIENEAPGSGSFRRGSKTNDNSWVIDQSINLSNTPKNDNKSILKQLNEGLTGVTLIGDPTNETLAGVLPQYISLGFDGYAGLNETLKTIRNAFKESAKDAKIHLNFDPIGKTSLTGIWKSEDIELGVNTLKENSDLNLLRVFTVNAQHYHNAGGNAVSELAFALAQAHEYLVAMLKAGITIDVASAHIKVNLAQGRDFFAEIAKIRAFRILWSNMIDQYKPAHNCSRNIIVHTYTSKFYSTLYDPYVNMLRTTTQSMSAIVGGADIVTTLSYNEASNEQNSFSERIARNMQLLLQEESYLDKVIDPAGGSYYVEYLTNELAQKAWNKFQKIEHKGGFIGLMTSGNLARELKEDADEQLLKLEQGSIQVLGVTLHPNENDKVDAISQAHSIGNNAQFNPIQLLRLVENVEAERMNKTAEA
jgi:methylmalonyl-CoA mutase